jgi:DNA-binding NarL/FixJ family response regulator
MATPIDPITVMIVDDHEMVRRGACSYLEAQPDISVVAQPGQVKRRSSWRKNSSRMWF